MNGLWWKAASCSQSTQEAVFFFKNYLFILVVLGLRCFAQAFSVGESRGSSLFWCSGFSLWWFLVLQSTGSRRIGSVVVVHRLSCSAACGIFLDQGLNLCPLHWQVDSNPLHHQGSPTRCYTLSVPPALLQAVRLQWERGEFVSFCFIFQLFPSVILSPP